MESKIEATHRLRQEGRWEAASLYRDEVRKRHRSDGMKRSEANEAAWESMLNEYPPIVDEPVEDVAVNDDAAAMAELAARSKGQEVDVNRDVKWAYDEMVDMHATPLDAPSIGAWNMLRWARNDPNRFYGNFVYEAFSREKAERELAGQQRERMPLDERGRMPLDEVERLITDVEGLE